MTQVSPRVSIVMPVHNAAPFVRMALDSALAQTLSNLEVVCIDDGSSDASLALLQEAARLDPRVRVHAWPENRGASAARNAGIAASRGDYLFFLDADDSIPVHALHSLWEAVCATGCRMAVGSLFWARDPAQLVEPPTDPGAPGVTVTSLSESAYLQSVSGSHCCNLYQRRLLTEAGIRYDADLSYGEDQLFQARAFAAAGPIAFVDTVVYVYHHYRQQSVTRRPTVLKNLLDSVEFRCRIARLFSANGLGDTARGTLGAWSFAIREYWLQIPVQLPLEQACVFFERFRAMAREFGISPWNANTPRSHRHLLDLVMDSRDDEAYVYLRGVELRADGVVVPPTPGAA